MFVRGKKSSRFHLKISKVARQLQAHSFAGTSPLFLESRQRRDFSGDQGHLPIASTLMPHESVLSFSVSGNMLNNILFDHFPQ